MQVFKPILRIYWGKSPLVISNCCRWQSTIQPGQLWVTWRRTIHEEWAIRFMGKSPVKLQFPTFGRLDDTPDPFQCLERFYDFHSQMRSSLPPLLMCFMGLWEIGGMWPAMKSKPGRNSKTSSMLPSVQGERERESWETVPTCISHYASAGNQTLKELILKNIKYHGYLCWCICPPWSTT